MSGSRPPAANGENSPTGPRAAILVAVAVVAALLLIGGIIWALNRGDDSPSEKNAGTPDPGSTTAPTPTPKKSGGATPGGPSPSSGQPSGSPSTTRKPQHVRLNEQGQAAKGIDLRIAKIESVKGESHIPGEVSGPALRLTVEVTNQRDRAVPIGSALANFYYGKDRKPATSLLKPGSKWFPKRVAANGTATGVYVFSVPKNDRDVLALEVILDNQLRTVEFNGSCASQC